jgi:hypothetical protein
LTLPLSVVGNEAMEAAPAMTWRAQTKVAVDRGGGGVGVEGLDQCVWAKGDRAGQRRNASLKATGQRLGRGGGETGRAEERTAGGRRASRPRAWEVSGRHGRAALVTAEDGQAGAHWAAGGQAMVIAGGQHAIVINGWHLELKVLEHVQGEGGAAGASTRKGDYMS